MVRNNLSRYEAIIQFTSIGCVKAGWLIKQKGKWYITEEGRQAYTTITEPANFLSEIHRLYRTWRHNTRSAQDSDDGHTQNNILNSHIVLENAEQAAWQEIESHLSQLNPYEVQNLIAGLLRAIGHHVVWIAPPGPDGGVDIIAYTDALGLQGPRIKVQVRLREGKASSNDIRQFLALLGEGDVGLFVSTAGFTCDAEEESRRQEKRRITLLDLEKLFDLWVEYYPRIPEEARRLLPIQPVYFLSLSTR